MRLSQVRLQAGYKSGLQFTANGQVERLNPNAPLQSAVAQFKLSARAADLKDLSTVAGVELPGLGALVINSDLSLQRSTLKLEDIRVRKKRKKLSSSV